MRSPAGTPAPRGCFRVLPPRTRRRRPRPSSGRRGKWEGEDVVHILLQQPACAATSWCGKIYRDFVERESSRARKACWNLCAEQFRKSDYDVAARDANDPRRRDSSISGPRASGSGSRARLSSYSWRGPIHLSARAEGEERPGCGLELVNSWKRMGQALFARRTSRAGLAEGWLNTSTILARNNFGQNRSQWWNRSSGTPRLVWHASYARLPGRGVHRCEKP